MAHMHATAAMLVGLAAGAAAGALAPGAVDAIEPVGNVWFNGLRMTVIPIVAAQLVLGVNERMESGALGRLGLRAFGWFTALLAAAATFTAVAMPLALRLFPPMAAPAAAQAPEAIPGLGAWVAGLLPANLFEAAAQGRLLALILAALLFGVALRGVEATRKQAVLSVVAGVNEAMLIVVGWLLRVAPAGVAALTFVLVARLGAGAVGTLGLYVLTICVIVVAVAAPLYVLVALRGNVPVGDWTRAVAPVQALAFGSRSSMAALPAMVTAAGQLGLSVPVTGFVLPMAASVFRYTATVAQVGGAIFVAQLYGRPLDLGQLALLVATSVLLTYSAPGIPSSALLVALPLYQQLGLPAEGLALLLAADAVPDMFKTAANVTAHMAVAAVMPVERGAA